MSDPYLDENGELKTLIKAATPAAVSLKEAFVTAVAASRLLINPIKGDFDFKHFQKIHEKIFGEVYKWAGKPRTISMSKGSSMFCRPEFMQSSAKVIFSNLQKDITNWRESSSSGRKEIPEKLAEHLNEINALHSFREGNGRTQKAFIGQVAGEFGLNIHWEKMSKEDYISACVDGFHSRRSDSLAKLFKRHTKAIEKKMSDNHFFKSKPTPFFFVPNKMSIDFFLP